MRAKRKPDYVFLIGLSLVLIILGIALLIATLGDLLIEWLWRKPLAMAEKYI
jgi:hypothetical protein